MPKTSHCHRIVAAIFAALAALAVAGGTSRASTYVVYIPLDSPIYEELETLSGLGYLADYLDEIKPVSRVEAARLTLEAQRNLSDSENPDPLASNLINALSADLHEEVQWLRSNAEDKQPTMVHPVERIETEYLYSRGTQRFWNTGGVAGLHASEGTPLFTDNQGIPTGAGSNEIMKLSGWGGFGGFLTVYGEGAVTGPFTRGLGGTSRLRALGAEAVLDVGNFAISFGQEEMSWGTGHFASLSQGDNAAPIPGLRVQNVHPSILPGVFRYLGQFRYQLFLGQLDGGRYFAHPWIDGQIFSFKPLPNFEFGITHAIMFGGLHNDSYSMLGFLGRATGLSTGSSAASNTNSRAGIYLKFRFPKFRNLQVYQEILGEDNLTNEFRPVGGILPFLAVSYQGGVYLPRLTRDGLTDMRFEYALLEPNYSMHSDSLYWTYNGWLMGDPMGPNASKVDLQIGRWFDHLTKASLDAFYTERSPSFGNHVLYPAQFYGTTLSKEHSGGFAIDVFHVPDKPGPFRSILTGVKARAAFEYVNRLNFGPENGIRGMLLLSTSLTPTWDSFAWK